jgi:hypothetical protein
MPKLQTRATVKTTTKTEVKLTTKQQNALRKKLAVFAEADVAFKAAKEERDVAIADIEDIREQLGETSFEFEGATVTRVGGDTSKLDKKKLVELGCALAWIEEATTTKPKKQHTRVTLGGDDEEDDS